MNSNLFFSRFLVFSMLAAWALPQLQGQTWVKPDFSVTAIQLDPAPTVAGQTFTAKVTVVNHGAAAADAGMLRVWRSQFLAVAPGTAGDAELAVGVLDAGESKVLTFAGLTAATVAGTHHFRAYVDADNLTEEWSEGSNQLVSVYTTEPDPDASGRVEEGLLALYTFLEGEGNTVSDQIGDLDLTLLDPDDAEWIEGGGLRFNGTMARSDGAATGLITALKTSGAISVEAWVLPVNATQGGPARMVTLSSGTSNRNFTLGPDGGVYEMRMRTSDAGNNSNGMPALASAPDTVETVLQHVVYTRAADGAEKLYVDGESVAAGTRAGDFSNWADYVFGLGNETSGDRPWRGDMFLVAVYDRALDAEEIDRNFEAGVPEAEPAPEPEPTDLAVTEIAFVGDAPTETGEAFTLRVTVKNLGPVDSEGGTLHFFAHQPIWATPADVPADAAVAVGELAVDAEETFEATLTAPEAAGWYFVRGYLVSDQGDPNTGNNQATVLYSVAAPPEPEPSPTGRVEDNLLALYTFGEGYGETVFDQVGNLDLTILDPNQAEWIEGGGLRFDGTLAKSGGAASGLVGSLKTSGAITVEAWLLPANTTQNGPARIVTLSDGLSFRNFTLGQGTFGGAADTYSMRLRSQGGSNNGTPELLTGAGTLQTELQHVVFTRQPDGNETFYLDGAQVATGIRSGDFSNWAEFVFALGNETSGDRPWLGDMYLVALYDRALTGEEVEKNFDAGRIVHAPSCSPQSDAFVTGPGFQSFWRLLDPVGDAVASLSGTSALLHVPGGTSHDLWSGSGNLAPRMLQETQDGDFAIEARFESMPAEKYQMQGLIVQENDDTFLRFGTYHDGGSLYMFVAFIDGSAVPATATVIHSAPPVGGVIPSYLRVERRGDNWTYRYSDNGTVWQEAVSVDVDLQVTESGFYAANHTPNPAFTAHVDYFRSVGCPFPVFEDWMKPNFTVTAVNLVPVPNAVGELFDAEVTILNNGLLAGDAGVLRAWMHRADIPAAGEAGDADLAAGPLAIGESRTLTFTGLTAPTESGTYHFRAFVDAEDETAEWSEGDNQFISVYTLTDGSVPASWEKPDFTVTSVVLDPVPSAPGDVFSATVVVRNVGLLAGDAGVLRVTPFPGGDPVDLAAGSLEIGESTTLVFPGLTAPATAGTYLASAIVDADLEVPELSEGNNQLVATYTIFDATALPTPIPAFARPEFAVTSVDFVGGAPTTTGQPYTVRVTVTNSGQVAGDAGTLYLFSSMPGLASPGDESAANVAVPIGLLDASGPGSTKTVDVQLVTPATRGVHQTRAYLLSPETEWSTGNNQLTATSWIKLVTLVITPVGADVELTWNNYWGDTYTLYRKVGAGEFEPLATDIPSARPVEFNTYLDTPPAGVLMYRVEIQP